MARVLLTGGCGFIGSHVLELLLEAGHEPVVLDRRDAAGTGSSDEVEHVLGDVRDPSTVARALRGAELVCHQAAMVGLGVDLGDIADYVSHNDLGTAVLLRAIAAAPAPPERVVLASSMVVYGEGAYRCGEHGAVRPAPRAASDLERGRFEPRCPSCASELSAEPIRESAALDPRNVYAATKLQQEHLCRAFARETGIPVTALRYHNVYGPRMPRDTPYAGVAALFADALAAGRAPRVFEDGRQRRDFVHVRDVARANLLALTAVRPVDGPLNVCSGRPRSVGELAGALHEAAGGDEQTAPIVTGQFRLGDVRHVFADPARARDQLGFEATEELGDGLRELASELGIAA